ncbi:MAG: RES domain-containing protein [Gammaproteobacteria bacterium]
MANRQDEVRARPFRNRRCSGRWSLARDGPPVIYAGLSAEIAALEKLVHTGKFLPRDLVFVELTLPDDPALYEHKGAASLPAGWDSIPTRQLSQGPSRLFISPENNPRSRARPSRSYRTSPGRPRRNG